MNSVLDDKCIKPVENSNILNEIFKWEYDIINLGVSTLFFDRKIDDEFLKTKKGFGNFRLILKSMLLYLAINIEISVIMLISTTSATAFYHL